jgi:oxidase EvaA
MPGSLETADVCHSFLKSRFQDITPRHSLEEITSWMKSRTTSQPFEVQLIDFADMDTWSFEKESGDLVHSSGRFFRVEGLRCNKNYGEIREWEQPIINQQEIGILGFISKEFDGLRHFLVQAKMEPGNINTVQLSPTVQATNSNYTRVHKGKLPTYLEYFLDSKKSILVDQLQSEQGTRFLRKRNRNIVIDCKNEIEVHEDFMWATLAQLNELTALDNHINMEARSILSCIALADAAGLVDVSDAISMAPDDAFSKRLILSGFEKIRTRHSTEEVLQWMTEQKSTLYIRSSYLPLGRLSSVWNIRSNEIIHESERFFSIIAAQVTAGSREVSQWSQPLVSSFAPGITGWICREIDGALHFLMNIRPEPGSIDVAELAPTVSSTDGRFCIYEDRPPRFLDSFIEADPKHIRHDSWQSAEGGRFYHDTSRCLILEIDDFDLSVPDNYRWLTLGQIQTLMQSNNVINVECRDLLSCINYSGALA